MPVCKGHTAGGRPCKRIVKNGEYCHSHRAQASRPTGRPSQPAQRPRPPSMSTQVTICKGHTARGEPCKRKVKNGEYCHSHRAQASQSYAHSHAPSVSTQRPQTTNRSQQHRPPNPKPQSKSTKARSQIINKKFAQEKPDECAICLESLENQAKPLSCGHWVHTDCIIKSGKSICPFCRAKIKLTSIQQTKLSRYAEQYRGGQRVEDEEASQQAIAEYTRANRVTTIPTHNTLESLLNELVDQSMNITNYGPDYRAQLRQHIAQILRGH